MDKFGINNFDYREGGYTTNGIRYSIESLIEASKDLISFDLPLAGIDISATPWGGNNISNFIFQFKRINACNFDYPIILDSTGYICDGWHRVAKAIIEGRDTIKAKRLTVMPEGTKI